MFETFNVGVVFCDELKLAITRVYLARGIWAVLDLCTIHGTIESPTLTTLDAVRRRRQPTLVTATLHDARED